MGMYDTILCKYPLPDPEAQKLQFQTKDLDNTLTTFEISPEGRLLEQFWEYEKTPEEEKPYPGETGLRGWIGSTRRKEGSFRAIDRNYHGMLQFYGDRNTGEIRVIDVKTGQDRNHPDPVEWYEYRAKFTDGTLVEITRIRRDWPC